MGVEGLYGDFFEKPETELPRVSMLVNEKFVETMGWDNPIGKKITASVDSNPRDRVIAGVFKDYNTLSLHNFISKKATIIRFSHMLHLRLVIFNMRST